MPAIQKNRVQDTLDNSSDILALEDFIWTNLTDVTYSDTSEPTNMDYRNAWIKKWSMLLPLVLLVGITITSNGTVILMLVRTKRLRKFKYNFIASLAVADFLIGCTEPVSLLETVSGLWSHSTSYCKLFLAVRYSLYYVSFLSIILISVDRWYSIYHPFSYRVKQSKRLAVGAILLAWIISFIIHGTPIMIWDYFDHHSSSDGISPAEGDTLDTNGSISYLGDGTMCAPPYQRDITFLTLSVILENLLPLVALAILNISVYVKILRRKSTKIRRSLSTTDNFLYLSRKSSSDSDTAIAEDERDILPDSVKQTFPMKNSLQKSSCRRHSISHALFNQTYTSKLRQSTQRRVSFDATILSHQFPARKRPLAPGLSGGSLERRRSTGDELLRDLFLRQDKKAACALGLLVVVFVFCWTPHCIVSILRASCSQCIPIWVVNLTHWLLAANSAMNPFLYAIGNSEFRKAIRNWTGCVDKQELRKRETTNVFNNSYYLLVS